jgi:hypothetical protein
MAYVPNGSTQQAHKCSCSVLVDVIIALFLAVRWCNAKWAIEALASTPDWVALINDSLFISPAIGYEVLLVESGLYLG